jgi:hypothetical protein
MKKSILLVFLTISLIANGQKLPDGVTKTSTPCSLAKGLSLVIFNKDNNMIAKIEPSGCNYSNSDGPQPAPVFQTDFYPAAGSNSFKTNDEAMKWLLAEMDKYYKPVIVTKWQKLDNAIPKISLKYPEGWTFRTDKDDYFAKPAGPANNKIVLIVTQPNGSNEIIQIIRTPNTGKVNTQKFMENSSKINPAINFKTNPPTDQVIGGKTFKTTENSFAMVMQQRHYWYADDKEVIYIGYGLLKDDRTRYPKVVADIINSITW